MAWVLLATMTLPRMKRSSACFDKWRTAVWRGIQLDLQHSSAFLQSLIITPPFHLCFATYPCIVVLETVNSQVGEHALESTSVRFSV